MKGQNGVTTLSRIALDTVLSIANRPCMLNVVMPSVVALTQMPEVGLLDKSSCLVPALGVTKFIIARVMILVTLCCAT